VVPIVVMVVGFVLAIFDSVVVTFPRIDLESVILFDDSVLFVLCTAPKYKESILFFK